MKKIIFLGILIGLLFTQNVQVATAKLIAGNTEEVLNRVVDFILYNLPGVIKNLFEEKVLPIWSKMHKWFEENIWENIKPLTRQEIERRKQIAEEEAKKERDELLREIEEISIKNDFWQKMKKLLIEVWN